MSANKYGTAANASANAGFFAAAAQACEKVADIVKAYEGKQFNRRLSNALNELDNVSAYIDDGIKSLKSLDVRYYASGYSDVKVRNDWSGGEGSVQLVCSMRPDENGKVPEGYHVCVEERAAALWNMSMRFEAIAEGPGIVKNAKERIGVLARQMNDYIESLDDVLLDLVDLDSAFTSQLGVVARYY